MKLKRSLFPSIITISAAAALTGSLAAAPITWSGTTDTDFATDTNWLGDTAPTNDLFTDTATFSAPVTANLPDLSTGDYSVLGLDFQTGGYTLGGSSSLSLGPGGIEVGGDSIISTAGLVLNEAIDINLSGGTLDITSQLSGSGAVTINDTGASDPTVHLFFNTNSATFSGDYTVIGNAVLRSERYSLHYANDINPLGTITLQDGGTLTADGDHLDLSGRNIVLTGTGGTLQHAHARNVYGLTNIVISGTELTVSGGGDSSTAGRMQLEGTNTYTDGTRIVNGGQAWVYSDASLGAADTPVTFATGTIYAANNVDFNNRAMIIDEAATFNMNGKTVTVDGVISGDGSLTVTNGGNLNITSENNTFAGGTTVDGGSLINLYGQTNALAAGDITLDNGGGLKNRNNRPTIANNIILGDGVLEEEETVDGGTLTAGWTNRNITVTGLISGDGSLTIGDDSSAVIITNAANNYAGGTTIHGAVLTNGSLGTGDITLGNANVDRGMLMNNDSNTTLTNNLAITADGARLKAGWNKRLTIVGEVSGDGPLTVIDDSGTVELVGDHTYTGETILADGDAIADANVSLKVTGSLSAGNHAGLISGDGTFEFSGTGTQILSATNTYTGGTTISGGTLLLNDVNSIGTGPVTLATGGTLDVNGIVLPNTFADSPAGTLQNTGAAVDYSTTAISSNGANLTVDGTGDITLGDITRLGGNPTVTKNGSNTLTMSGTADNVSFRAEVNSGTFVMAKTSTGSVHTIGGLLTVNDGTAQLGGTGNDQIYNGSTVTLNGGTFDINTRDERIKFLNLFGGDITGTTGVLTVNSFSGDGFIDARSGTVTVAISGDAPLVKTTAGTVTLSGANTSTGDTTVSEGTLTLAAANPANDSSAVAIASGATLNLDFSGTDTVDSLFLGGVQQASGVYDSSNSGGLITGTGSLTVASDPPAGFAGWITGIFANGTVPADQQGANDDPDGDGIANLVEYAISGQDPTVANTKISTFADGSLSFAKSATATGITYAILESTDLGFTDAWTEVTGTAYVNDPTTISYEMTPGSPEKNFIRLQVTRD